MIDLPILLTGTIIPNSILVNHLDFKQRKEEYIEAIKYYQNFGQVIFLENSIYDLESDNDFNNLVGVQIVKFKPSAFPDKGKGFQEFEMIDTWIANTSILPERFIKITGRYIIKNFQQIYSSCKDCENDMLIIDSYKKMKLSQTHLFFTSVNFYRNKLMNLYLDADDSTGDWIEKIVYRKIHLAISDCLVFTIEPRVFGTSGSSGKKLAVSVFKYLLRVIRRKVNLIYNKSEIFI